MEKSLPHIGRKPFFLPPYILHLYQQYECINEEEEDALTIAEDEVVYKLGPEIKILDRNRGVSRRPRHPRTTPFRSHSEDKEGGYSAAPKRGRSQQGATMEGY
jgi:hypothetical protein